MTIGALMFRRIWHRRNDCDFAAVLAAMGGFPAGILVNQ